MKTYPIPFTAPMVRAILSGTKSQTRRPVKPQPREPHWVNIPGYVLDWRNPHGATWVAEHRIPQNPQVELEHHACPYGVPGDLLWVKETWQAIRVSIDPETGYGDDIFYAHDIPPARTNYWSVVYAADPGHESSREERGFPWRSPRFMPRWASRLTLELTDVRVQRVQEISEVDAEAEGVPYEDCWPTYTQSFEAVWDSLNAKRGYGWAENPWVWALSFRVHHANVDAVLAERAAA